MSYLTRLLARARGELPTVEPLIAPSYGATFAATQAARGDTDGQDAPARRRERAPDPEPRADGGAPSSRGRTDTPAAPLERSRQTATDPQTPTEQGRRPPRSSRPGRVAPDRLERPAARPDAPSPPTPADAPSASSAETGAAPRVRDGASHAEPPGGVPVRVRSATPAGPPAGAPAGAPVEAFADPFAEPRSRGARPGGEETSQGPPTINVTIGRIEVKAAGPPAAPAAGRKSTPTATLSLEDYLENRFERGPNRGRGGRS